MINILITLDYEIFGKGTGDVKKHIIKPTEKILQICDKYNVPLTIMFEVNEYMKFEEYNDILIHDLGYSPANLVKEQVLNAFKKGHDVQLHIHPQWVDAEYKEGKWIMKNPERSITDFSNGKIKEVLREGKYKLENLLKPLNPDYECVAMRLTNMGWTEAPEEIINHMRDVGIKIHSLSDSDNPQNNVKGYWALDSSNEVFEFPIHSIKVPKYKMFTPRRIITALYRYKYTHRNTSEKKKCNNADESKHSYLLSLFKDSYSLKWDFCKQSSREMINFLEIALERYDYKNNKVPLVMIGHSKDFFNRRNFKKFLKIIKGRYMKRKIVNFNTLGDFSKSDFTKFISVKIFKVLLLGRSFKFRGGGVTNYLRLLIPNLSQEKIQIKHFVQGKSPIRWKNIFLPFIILYQLIKFRRVIKTYKPDLIHINPSLGPTAIVRDFAFLKIAKKKRIPVLFFIHGWQHTLSNKFKENGYWKNYFKKRFALSDAIVVLAKEFKEELVKLGIPEERIYVSSTMVESEEYLPDTKDFSPPFKILFCAGMHRKKGPYEVLKAAPFVLKKYHDAKFIFMGDGVESENLKKFCSEMELDSNVEFIGYKWGEEKIIIFKNSHIFVYPSYTEGFPLVILEAMAAGMPLITTPVGGLADAIEDGKQGLIIKSMLPNPKEVAEKIVTLIENPTLMKKMSENNLREAKEKYDVRIVCRNIETVYRRTMGEE